MFVPVPVQQKPLSRGAGLPVLPGFHDLQKRYWASQGHIGPNPQHLRILASFGNGSLGRKLAKITLEQPFSTSGL